MIFWICLILVVHTYVLYPCLLFLAYAFVQVRNDLRYLIHRRDRRHSPLLPDQLPAVSFVIPAYNEEKHLVDKIANLRELDYPTDRLQVIFVSDGSTDGTNEILCAIEEPHIETVFLPRRQGKLNALNQAVARARHDVLIFSDASTLFLRDALRQLVRHFSDHAVGVVCGTLKLRGNSEFEQTEGVYWRYESMLRLMEARVGATLTASGAIYALRRECFRPLTADDVIDDFVIPMNARKLGYRVLYDPEAEAVDFAAPSVKDEFTRRVRLAVGSFKALRDFSRVPMSAFANLAFLSRKVLRWILPFLMIGLLVTNALLWSDPFYRLLFIGQLLFYFWATIGFVFRNHVQRVPYALLAYFIVAINMAFLVGFVRFLGRRNATAWQRVT